MSKRNLKWDGHLYLRTFIFWDTLKLSLQILTLLEIYWNLKPILEILKIYLNFIYYSGIFLTTVACERMLRVAALVIMLIIFIDSYYLCF